MIVETFGWCHLKEKNKLFPCYEYQKMYNPSPKTVQLSKVTTNRKWKTISPLRFKKSDYVIRLFSNDRERDI